MKALLSKVREIAKNGKKRRIFTRFVSIVGALIVFITTYALVLPAITLEKTAVCGIEEHQHDESCYETRLICGQEESDGHHHDDSCYEITKKLVCDVEEHQHSVENGCYDADGNLICEKQEHVHDDSCYEEVKTLICGLEESEGHHHTDACYEKVLVCGKEVHTHSAECYQSDSSAVAATEEAAGSASTATSGGSDSADSNTAMPEQSAEDAAAGMTDTTADAAVSENYVPTLDPLNMNAVLDKHTDFYYFHAEDDEEVPANSADITDWQQVKNETELASTDLVKMYLSYTIPAGSLNETNPTARYRLPENIHLTDDQIKKINKNKNGFYSDYRESGEDTDKYLGAEAVEGTRRPDEELDDDAQEYISAVVKAENVYKDDQYVGQDLIFTFVPYTIEKNQNTYDVDGSQLTAGKKVTGWFVCDFTLDQIDWIEEEIEEEDKSANQADDNDSAAEDKSAQDNSARTIEKTADIIFVTEDKDEDIEEIKRTLKVVEQTEVAATEETQEFKAGTLTADGDGYKITLDYTEDAKIPENASLSVREITADTDKEAYEACLAQAQQHVDESGETKSSVDSNTSRFFDIEILVTDVDGNSQKMEPAAPVSVNIQILDNPADSSESASGSAKTQQSDPTVLHFADEGVEQVDSTAKTTDAAAVDKDTDSNSGSNADSGNNTGSASEGGEAIEIQFEAESFSIYGVVYTVDFHWEVNGKTYEFKLPGGGFISLEHLIEVLGINDSDTSDNTSNSEGNSGDSENETDENSQAEVLYDGESNTYEEAININNEEVSEATKQFVADVTDVEFSDPNLVWVGKVDADSTVGGLKDTNGLEVEYSAELTEEQIAEINAQSVEAGDWALISILPFTGKETLTVSMKNGDQFVVKVTDAVDDPHVTVHYVDRDGNVLTGVQYSGENLDVIDNEDGTFTIPYSTSEGVDLREQFKKDGYTYANTHLAGKDHEGNTLTYNGLLIDSALFIENEKLNIKSDSGETYLRDDYPSEVKAGNKGYTELQSYPLDDVFYARTFLGSNANAPKVYSEAGNKDIYVVLDPEPESYSGSSDGSGSPVDVKAPKLKKTMESNGDGTYTLSLKVDAHAKNVSDTNKANVLFVVDTSSSMRKYTTSDKKHSRITDTHDVILEMGQKMLAYNTDNPDAVEVSMITFDGGVEEPLDWTTETDTFVNSVNNWLKYYYLHTGTDWEDGMKGALEQLLSDTDDDPTFVIFFTDGEPSQYTSFHGKGENTNTDCKDPITDDTSHETVADKDSYPNFYSFFLSREGSKDEMRAIVNAGATLYGIFAYNPTTETYDGYNGEENGADMLHNAIKYGYNTDSDLTNSQFYNAENTEDLKGAFDKIFNLIKEKVGFSNVVVKDGIAAGVTSSAVVDGDVSGFTYIIRDKSGALAYKVTVAPNGVPEGETVDDGTPIFTLSDGTVVIGEKKSVSTTKIKTDEQGQPVLDTDGKIQTEAVDVEVYYYKDANGKEYIMPISTTGENISWDLSPLGILQDGYSYEVKFVVWPNQDAYDLVADLNNGKRLDLETSANWDDQEILTDSDGNKYRIGGFAEYPYIARYEETGIYAAMSNTGQSVEYYKAHLNTVNGEEVTEYTGPISVSVDPPDPMPLTASSSQIEKVWNVDRDPGILAQLLYGKDGNSVKYKIPFDVLKDDDSTTTEDDEANTYTTVTLGWDETADEGNGAYSWDSESTQTVTYNGHSCVVGTRWLKDFSIATGLMLSEERMEALGLDKNAYPSGTYEGITYYLLEKGHDYTIKEPDLTYEFDFKTQTYHPMLVDDVLRSVNLTVSGNSVSISSMTSASEDLSSLKVENTLRGYINLDKVVVGANGATTVPEDDTKFEYKIVLENSTEPGPFTVAGSHIPWYGINDLFYHDADYNYYQATPDGEGKVILEDEDGNTYNASCEGEFAEDVGPVSITFTDSTGTEKTIQLYGNQMDRTSDNYVSATLKIAQGETLDIANVPVGTTYSITESDQNGYNFVKIVKEIKVTPDGETESSDTSTNSTAITGTIVANRDNHIIYYNKSLITDITIQKTDTDWNGLEGAVFQLKTVSDDGHSEADATTAISTVSGLGIVKKTVDGNETNFPSSFESTGGIQTISGLPDGTYRLYEVFVPDGYISTFGYIQFEIKDRVIKNVTTKTGDTSKLDTTDNNIDIKIANEPGAELPYTGGPGTHFFTILGSMLIFGAGLLLWKRRRLI